MSLPVMIVGTKRYLVAVENLTIRYEIGAMILDPGRKRPVRECEHCHRADWVPDYAYSFEEAVAKGWLVEDETGL